ncbi:MAG TPA: hypothetical protein VLE95_00295 [Chlamydiales bacterium]|nr:hypothetical protein [Chlamydiales bacterium]
MKPVKIDGKIYRNNLKNREFDKEAAQFFASGASDHCLRQGASEDQKNAAKPTSSKTDSSDCFGIRGFTWLFTILQEVMLTQ